ncbi:unnamed protein product [Adineta steineri]|uniref:Uncharacterized protein n=1 Tax=Adineta steineri TaxID=433720 RepID=A0A819EVY7_9BILA|nr:unnamed protein product [Adineta steineri]CAF3858270.1 unnamed protein product [Adineta steineri]
MSFENTYETPLRSYIETRARTLRDSIEAATRDRNASNATALEQRIDRESDQFVDDVTRRLNIMRDEIKGRRPTDERHPDYSTRMTQYQQFVSLASVGVNRVTSWVNLIFKKIIDVIKQTVEWINDTAQTSSNHNNSSDINRGVDATGATSSSTLTQTVTTSIRKNCSELKTLVLRLKPDNRQPDLSSLDSKQLDTFVDEMIGDFQNTFTNNINDLRARIKSARPDPSDPNYTIKMDLYQDLLTTMVPVIQKIQSLAGQLLNELQALIDQLWDDICKNNGREVDRLLDEHAHRTEAHTNQTFVGPLSILEARLKQIRQKNSSH